ESIFRAGGRQRPPTVTNRNDRTASGDSPHSALIVLYERREKASPRPAQKIRMKPTKPAVAKLTLVMSFGTAKRSSSVSKEVAGGYEMITRLAPRKKRDVSIKKKRRRQREWRFR